jgi:hypothetical protein
MTTGYMNTQGQKCPKCLTKVGPPLLVDAGLTQFGTERIEHHMVCPRCDREFSVYAVVKEMKAKRAG